MKFCQYVAKLYLHTFTKFGWFILIFSKMALTILAVPIDFMISSFESKKSNYLDFIAKDDWSQFIWPQSLDYQIWAVLESYHKLPPKFKFKDALQLIWSALPEKAIDNAVIDHRKSCRHVCQPTVDILNI